MGLVRVLDVFVFDCHVYLVAGFECGLCGNVFDVKLGDFEFGRIECLVYSLRLPAEGLK